MLKRYWDTTAGTLAIAAIFAFVLAVLAVPAKAADKGAPNFLEVPEVQPKSAWTGCGIGAYGSMLNGDVDTGSPINIGSNGQEAGVSVGCDVALGAFVIGAGADYGRVFGDLNTIGVDNAMSLNGRAGVLLSTNTLLYVLAARSRLDTAAGNLDGWQYGGGLETKLKDYPMFLRAEWRRGTYDLADIGGPSLDAQIDTVRLGLVWKFNFTK